MPLNLSSFRVLCITELRCEILRRVLVLDEMTHTVEPDTVRISNDQNTQLF